MFIYKVYTCGKLFLHRQSHRVILLRLWKTLFPQITNGQVHRDLLHMQKLSHWVLGQKSSPIPYCVGQNHSKHQVLMLHDNAVFDSEDKKQTWELRPPFVYKFILDYSEGVVKNVESIYEFYWCFMRYCVDFVIFWGLTFGKNSVRLTPKITRTLSIYKVFIRYLSGLYYHYNITIDSQYQHLIENERKHLKWFFIVFN